MERPALKQLMGRIKSGEVDTIVVYKIDRLTRSLTDFARLAELLDQHKVSFVSITQQFNTTTSMGRLMLNVLLSFAQFEREITGERIRDKIAASKRKGMWMGGVPPIGYDIKDRGLVINEPDAETVRKIFSLYLEAGSVPALMDRLQQGGIRTATRYSAKGNHYGDRPFTRGHLYKLLANPIYIGRVPHGKTSHRGLQEAIIDRPTWDAVQALLEQNTQGSHDRRRRAKASVWLLDGLLRSDRGNRFVASHTTKGSRRYRYYVEQIDTATEMSPPQKQIRLSAREIENTVITGLKSMLIDHRGLMARFDDLPSTQRSQLILASKTLVEMLLGRIGPTMIDQVRSMLRAVEYRHDRLALVVSGRRLLGALLGQEGTTNDERSNASEAETNFSLTVPLTYRRRGQQMKLAVAGQEQPVAPNHSLVTAIVRAWDWADRLISGEVSTMAEICSEEGFSDTYVGQLLPLAFLAPQLVESILEGRHDMGLRADHLIRQLEIFGSWGEH